MSRIEELMEHLKKAYDFSQYRISVLQETNNRLKEKAFPWLNKKYDKKYEFDEQGNIFGFKYKWFKEKYPEYTYEIYKEPMWVIRSLEILEGYNFMCQCEACKGEGRRATEVHHIKNFYNNPQSALLPSNLMAVNWECHQKKTKENKESFKKYDKNK